MNKDPSENIGMFHQFSFSKPNENNVSNVSGLSQGFAFQNFNLSSFQNNFGMNLSKPTDINFDKLSKVPNISNFTANMQNSSGVGSAFKNPVNMAINLLLNQPTTVHKQAVTQRFGINTSKGQINIPLERNKKLEIELVDDNTIQIKTVDKNEVSNVSGIFTKNNMLENEMKLSCAPSNPNNMFNNKFCNYISKIESLSSNHGKPQENDTISISKAYKFQFIDSKDNQEFKNENSNFRPDFKVYNQHLKPAQKSISGGTQKSNSTPLFHNSLCDGNE